MRLNVYFYVLIRAYEAFSFFDRCVESVLNQAYTNYKILFVDDASNYNTSQKNYIRKKLSGHIAIFNKRRKYAIRNAYEMIHKFASNNDAVVVNLDGDDWFLDAHILSYLNNIYNSSSTLLTYGDCLLWDGKSLSPESASILKLDTNIPYNTKVIKHRSYRKEPFLPLHLRTWKVWLYKNINLADFKRTGKIWLQFCEDQAMFYPMLETAGSRCQIITKPLSVYNQSSSYHDLQVHNKMLIYDEILIRRKQPYARSF